MVWVPKGGVPPTINFAEAFHAAITGDPTWGWLAPWVPLISNHMVNTEDLCAAGPREIPPLDAGNFLNRIGAAFSIGQYLERVAWDRLFGAYCEQVSEEGTTCVPYYMDTVSTASAVPPWNALGTPFPAGTTHVRWQKATDTGAGSTAFHVYWYSGTTFHSLQPYPTFMDNDTVTDIPVPATVDRFYMQASLDYGTHWNLFTCVPGSVVEWEPTPQPQPDGVIAPRALVYDDIAALGAELDNLELKSDVLLQMLTNLSLRLILPPAFTDEPVIATEEEIEIGDATGVVVTLTGIPAAISEDFGLPMRLHGAGRVTLGTAEGWLPAHDLEHTPFVLAPLPPGVTRVTINVAPPIVATYVLLRPPQPVIVP